MNLVHSLHFVHSTLEVLHRILQLNQAYCTVMMVLLKLKNYELYLKRILKKENIDIVIGRLAELRIVDKKTGITLTTHTIPYGSKLYVKTGQEIEKGNTDL